MDILKSALDSLNQIIFIVDRKLNIIYQNDKARKTKFLSQYSNKQPHILNIWERKQDCPALKVFHTESPIITEVSIKDGETMFFYTLTFKPLIENRKVKYVLIIAEDITEKKLFQNKTEEYSIFFKNLYEETSVAILIYQDDKVVFASPAACLHTGYSKEEIIGMNFWDLVDDSFKEIVKARGKARLEGKNPENKYEILIKCKDGSKKWVLLEGRATIFNGKPAGLITAIDIHEAKTAKKQLQNHFNLLSILHGFHKNLRFLSSKDLILSELSTILPQYGSITKFAIVLTDKNENTEKHIFYKFSEDEERQFIENLEKKLYTVKRKLRNSNYKTFSQEEIDKIFPLKLEDSIIFVSKIQYSNFFYGYFFIEINTWYGKPEKFELLLLNEIAQLTANALYNLEQSVKLSNLSEDFARFLEENIAAICITTPDGEILDCNQAFLNMFKFKTKDEVKTISAKRFYRKKNQREIFLEKLKWDKVVRNMEMEYVDKNGNEVIVLENAVGRFDKDGKLTHIYSFLYNITVFKHMESQIIQAEKLKSIAHFTGGIAHELNNMLTPIVTLTSFLMNKNFPEETKKILKIIHESSDKSAKLISKLLEFSRETKSEVRVLNFNKLLDDIIPLIKNSLGKQITIFTEIDKNLPHIKGDKIQLMQAILNIVENAKEAMPNGGIFSITAKEKNISHLKTMYLPELKEGKYIELSLSDTGIGIKRENINHIFEPFFTTKENGSGLGLSTSYGIIKKHGGTITVQSTYRKGTTFKIYLPLYKEKSEFIEPSKKKILIVDDEDVILESTKILLESNNFIPLVANSYQSALNQFNQQIDLAIIDIFLYDKSGIELAKELLLKKPDLPIIFISGSDEEKIIKKTFANKFKFLKKPFNAKKLINLIKKLTNHEF